MALNENEKRIINTFEEILPLLTEEEKQKLLAFGQGMAFKACSQSLKGLLCFNSECKETGYEGR